MLAEVVADIKQDWDWKETLDLSTELSLADTALEHDDLKRETLLLVLACLLIILGTWHVARHTIITIFSNHTVLGLRLCLPTVITWPQRRRTEDTAN